MPLRRAYHKTRAGHSLALKTRKISIPKLQGRAELRPATLNVEARTVEVVFTTGHRGLRRSWWSDSFYEELEVSDKAIRLDRLNNGGPFLDGHYGSNDSVLGVVERAWVDKGQGVALIRFSESEKAQEYFRDIKDGIRRNVSVGYVTHRYKEEVREGEDLKTRVATDWEPYEISLVAMGFDPEAQVRNAREGEKEELFEVEIETARDGELDQGSEGTLMSKTNTQSAPQTSGQTTTPATDGTRSSSSEVGAEPPSVNLEEVKRKAAVEERERASEIRKLVSSVRLADALAVRLIEDGSTVDQARKAIMDELARNSDATQTDGIRRIEAGNLDQIKTDREAVTASILHRHDPVKNKLDESSRRYRGLSLIDLARGVLESKGVNTRGMAAYEVAQRALHSSSDFAQILANVANKTMREGYNTAPQTFLPLIRTTTVPDFKEISRPQIGAGPNLDLVNESGEFTRGTIGDSTETYNVLTYGKIFGVTRKALINDDLNAFTRIPMMLGRKAADKESDLFWAIITGNQTMSDTVALFHADHENYTSSGTAIDVTSLGVARAALRNQTDSDGETFLNLTLKYLIVPVTKESIADQFIAANFVPSEAGKVNPFAGNLQKIVEPRLDANDTNGWYGAADPSQIDMIERAYLAGQEGVYLETREGFETDGVEWKVRLDVGFGLLDHRGFYHNEGA